MRWGCGWGCGEGWGTSGKTVRNHPIVSRAFDFALVSLSLEPLHGGHEGGLLAVMQEVTESAGCVAVLLADFSLVEDLPDGAR